MYYLTKLCTCKFELEKKFSWFKVLVQIAKLDEASQYPFRRDHSDEESNQLLRSAAYNYNQAKSKSGQDVLVTEF